MSLNQQLIDFSDLYTYCANELRVQVTSAKDVERIKRALNNSYNEVVAKQHWPWLRKSIDVSFYRCITDDAAFLTVGSTLVTLSAPIAESVTGYLIGIQGDQSRFKIAQHVAGASTLQLEAPFLNSQNSTINPGTVQIWTEQIQLPVDCREVVSVTHPNWNKPLEGVGMTRFKELTSVNPKYGAFPQYISTSEFINPTPYSNIGSLPLLSTRASTGTVRTLTFAATVAALLIPGQRIRITNCPAYQYNGDYVVSSVSGASITYTGRQRFTEAPTADLLLTTQAASVDESDARSKTMYVYPSLLTNQDLTLTVEYVIEVPPLINDADEPAIPVSDRIVLCYSALRNLWRSIGRSPEDAGQAAALYREKIGDMTSRVVGSTDYPVMAVDKLYLSRKRNPRSKYFYWE